MEEARKKRIQMLKMELDALKSGQKPTGLVARGKTSYPTVSPDTVATVAPSGEPLRFNINDLDLGTLRPELLEMMNDRELLEVVKAFMESNPRFKFKDDYPFLAEGMVIQKDYTTGDLLVFSTRLRQSIRISDQRPAENRHADYVYFLVLGDGRFRGFYFTQHPPHLISAKFRSATETVIHCFALLCHPIGCQSREDRWICWNDSLGMMPVRKSAAMHAIKKQPIWDKQLDIVSIAASYEMGGFVVTKIAGITNSKDKERHFPDEVFLIEDAFFTENRSNDHVFYSKALKSEILIAKTQIGMASDTPPIELIVAATFPTPERQEFRALLIISDPSNFWKRDKEAIRESLANRTDAYRI
uniref:NurA domain-containing protein n=1 Tax=Caenorhabditis tropicalis TaxID=1561998 RepID=A0A1I7T919_9PELO